MIIYQYFKVCEHYLIKEFKYVITTVFIMEYMCQKISLILFFETFKFVSLKPHKGLSFGSFLVLKPLD